MPWQEVVDPNEMRQVLGVSGMNKLSGIGTGSGGGKSGMSGVENKELVTAREANQTGRDAFPALAETYRVAKRYPGGIPQAVYDKARLAMGSEATPAQDYDLFNALSSRAGIAQARLLAPVSNTDLQTLIRSGPNPRLRFENNKKLIGMNYSNAARQYFDNALKQRFSARAGGTNVPLNGKSYAEVLAAAMKRPEVRNLIAPPWDRKDAAPKKGDRNGDGVVDFNDLKD
jgi:hypothetical protein